MRHLRSISILLVVAGVLCVAAAIALRLDPVWALTGLLLAWAGIVKLVVVRLWRDLARSDRAAPVTGDGD